MLSFMTLCLVLLILKTGASDTDADYGSVIVTANSHRLTYVKTELSANFDGESNYTYEDVEDMYIACENPQNLYILNLDSLRLEYYDAEGSLLFATEPGRTTQIFRTLLKSKNDKYYLDCIRATKDSEREYRYRTTFYVENRGLNADADQHAMILSINGQTLTVITNNNKLFDDYLFRYINEELLNVSCQKTDNNMRGTLRLYYNDMASRYVGPEVRSPLKDSILATIFASNTNSINLTCSISNSDVPKPNARLILLSDVPENEVRVRGLLRDNILYQYTNGLNRWTIEYQYSVNDTLNLTCVAKGSVVVEDQRFQWVFNGETSTSSARLSPTMIIVAKNVFSKILDATHDGKKLQCVYIPNSYSNKTVEIILRLKPGTEADDIVSSAEHSVVGETLSDGTDSKPSLLVLGGSIGVAVFVVLAVTGVACFFMKTRNAKRRIETSNEDFTNQYNSVYEVPSEYNNKYNVCHYNDTTPEIFENKDQEEHAYAEIDYFRNRPSETQTRNSLVYDEPSVQIPMSNRIQMLQRV